MIDPYKENEYVQQFNERILDKNYIKLPGENEMDPCWEDVEFISAIIPYIEGLDQSDFNNPDYYQSIKDYLMNLHNLIAEHPFPNIDICRDFHLPEKLLALLNILKEKRTGDGNFRFAIFSVINDLTRGDPIYIDDLLAENYLELSLYFLTNTYTHKFSLRASHQNSDNISKSNAEIAILLTYINIIMRPKYAPIFSPDVALKIIRRHYQIFTEETNSRYVSTLSIFIAHYMKSNEVTPDIINEIKLALKMWIHYRLGYSTYYIGNIMYQLLKRNYDDLSSIDRDFFLQWKDAAYNESPTIYMKVMTILAKKVTEAFSSWFDPADVVNSVLYILMNHPPDNDVQMGAFSSLHTLISTFPDTIKTCNHIDAIQNFVGNFHETNFDTKHKFFEYILSYMLNGTIESLANIDLVSIIDLIPNQMETCHDPESLELYVRCLLRFFTLIKSKTLYDSSIEAELNSITQDVLDILDEEDETENITRLYEIIEKE